MMTLEDALHGVVLLALACPAALLLFLLLCALPRVSPQEKTIARATSLAMLACTALILSAVGLYAFSAVPASLWTARTWFSSAAGALRMDLLVDGWSLAFALLATVISGTVAGFSYRYLHSERGFHRYFTLYACFVLGILLIALAGSVEVLFAGWELLGLSSALLVAFFNDRPAPVRNATRVFATYRVSDAAMLIAAVLVHHAVGSGSLSAIFLSGEAGAAASIPEPQLTAICVFFIAAVAGKSALLPLSGWLPRAMEGPTPSSAVYYGALSVHAGCYLLWRIGPLLVQSPTAQVLAVAAGASTALYASLVTRVQTDVKSALSYATLTQVGIIVVEIALGLRWLAFAHIVGNACLRLLQFLTAPNVMQDLGRLQAQGGSLGARAPDWLTRRPRLYLFLLERAALDALIDRWVVAPFLSLARLAARMDRALAGERPPQTTHPEERP